MKIPATIVTLGVLLLASVLSMRAADEEGFRSLFNGKDLTGWKFRQENGLKSWTVIDGILKNTVNPGEQGTDLVTEEKFWNFTVRYEYLIPEGSNSGFYLRGRHEIQIFDDFDAGKPAKNGNGAIYNHTAPAKFVSKRPGEWQTVEATMIDDKVTVILNGEKIHDNISVERATGTEIDNKVDQPGPFFLQGDHGSVSFQNIEVKTLPKEGAE